MKVKELIDELKFYNPNANVLFYNNDIGGHWKILTFDYDDFFPKVDENNEVITDENGHATLMQYGPRDTPYVTVVFQKDEDHKPIVATYKAS